MVINRSNSIIAAIGRSSLRPCFFLMNGLLENVESVLIPPPQPVHGPGLRHADVKKTEAAKGKCLPELHIGYMNGTGDEVCGRNNKAFPFHSRRNLFPTHPYQLKLRAAIHNDGRELLLKG
ncbi:hypothetical protein [uncultured Chitinophaga sp.]|uniref:hypothetical protein n=1 Tax=uncultured Chitinophaga sp. TaxID=339340 RepID=UPI0025F47A8D|nr:hypothetical protein [uncultured Chitinophaga sp.]